MGKVDRLPQPSHEKILEYWRKEGKEEVIGWYAVDNIGECTLGNWFCWCCGKPVSGENRLQRCHIVPHMLDGSNDVSNYFLMCVECHDIAPNTKISSIFFSWVKRHKSFYAQLFDDLYKPFYERIDEIRSHLKPENFDETFMNGVLNFEYGFHGTTLTRSSITGAIEYILDGMIEQQKAQHG